jgi:hypothetical protein
MPVDPATAALVVNIGKEVVKRVLEIPAVKRYIANLPDPNTPRFREARDELFREWFVEYAEKVAYLYASLQALADDVAELEARVQERSDDGEAQAVYANYARSAYQEPIEERRRMLAHAAAGVIDSALSVADHSRVERTLRELDPSDVLALHGLSQCAGNFYKGSKQHSLNRVRQLVWADWPRADVLVASGCVRISTERVGYGITFAPEEVASVTPFGGHVLHVLRAYVATRATPFEVPGRETPPGSRTREEALAFVHATNPALPNELPRAVRQPLPAGARRCWFDHAKRHDTTGELPPARAKGIIRLEGIAEDVAQRLGGRILTTPTSDLPMHGQPVDSIDVVLRRVDGRPGTFDIDIHGPHDVLRWLADDVGAPWL